MLEALVALEARVALGAAGGQDGEGFERLRERASETR